MGGLRAVGIGVLILGFLSFGAVPSAFGDHPQAGLTIVKFIKPFVFNQQQCGAVAYNDGTGTCLNPGTANLPLFTDIHWDVEIRVRNFTGSTLTNVVVTDRFSADTELGQHGANEGYPSYGATGALVNPEGAIHFLTPDLGPAPGVASSPTCGTVAPLTPVGNNTNGATLLSWTIGTMGTGQTCELVLFVSTDINPADKQEYTSPGQHCLNSGATIKFKLNGVQYSHSTGAVCVTTANS